MKKLLITVFVILMARAVAQQPDVTATASHDDSFLADTSHSLTIYVIPPRVAYDWSSPHSLYRSYVKNYKRNLLSRQNYLLGHAFLELRSTLLPERILTGMRAGSRNEQKQHVVKEHYGLAILGAGLEGRLETEQELEFKLDKYSRHGRLAFMKLLITEAAASRMIQFFEAYVSRFDTTGGKGAPYGGAFWPRYFGEGAGCSAFVVSFLDVAGLLREDYVDWRVDVNIPMSLIGGPYNSNHEVSFSDIRKAYNWADPDMLNSTEYAPFSIFDPYLMFDWIREIHTVPRLNGETKVSPVTRAKAQGIVIDGRRIPVPEGEEIMTERTSPCIFIDHYRAKSGN